MSSFVVKSARFVASPACVACDELDFIASVSSHKVATSVTAHLADTRQKLTLQHGLIRVGVLTSAGRRQGEG